MRRVYLLLAIIVGALCPPSLASQRTKLEALIVNFYGEPTIGAVQRKALAAYKSNSSTWLRRVRLAAWLPRFKVGFEKDSDLGTSIRKKGGESPTHYQRDYSDYGFALQAEWHLNELVFSSNELQVHREQRRDYRERERILEDVTEVYFSRRLAQIELHEGIKSKPKEYIKEKIHIEKMSAVLDAFTSGWFGLQLNRKKKVRTQ